MSVMNYENSSENYTISAWYGGDYFEIETPFCATSRENTGTMRINSRERMIELYKALCGALIFEDYASDWFTIYICGSGVIQIESDTITMNSRRADKGVIFISGRTYIIELVEDIADMLRSTHDIRYNEVVGEEYDEDEDDDE